MNLFHPVVAREMCRKVMRNFGRKEGFKTYASRWCGTAYDDGDPFIITEFARLDINGGYVEALAKNRQRLTGVVYILFRGREGRA